MVLPHRIVPYHTAPSPACNATRLTCKGAERDAGTDRDSGTDRRPTDRTQADHRGSGILHRRTDIGIAARSARRIGLFSWIGGGLHPRGAAHPDGYSGCRNEGIRSASETYAKLLASQIRQRFSSDWGLSETGATGPTGNRYGDAAGRSCIGVTGTESTAITLETGKADRVANMHAFASAALKELLQQVSR
jgi:hypothetical protein